MGRHCNSGINATQFCWYREDNPPSNGYLYGNIEFIRLLDLGASQHMTGRFEFLSHIQHIAPCFSGLPNGSHTKANSEGAVKLGPDLVIH